MDVLELNSFIVEAKSQTYVAGAKSQPSYRIGAHDIGYKRGIWRYLDSYFGGTDFAGQEVVWLEEKPVWAMNYFGRIIEPGIIDLTIAGTVICAALSQLYRQGRFLGDPCCKGCRRDADSICAVSRHVQAGQRERLGL